MSKITVAVAAFALLTACGGESEHQWNETAWLELGTYEIVFSANPGELRPYGNYIPSEPIERT